MLLAEAAAKVITAELSTGLQDFLPEQMLARQQIIDPVRDVFELYGYVPLYTPAIEYLSVLTGTAGGETQKALYRVISPEDEPLALRFDLTVPLARVVAQYPTLPRPFRRYQIAPVWRADKPGKGRFREFTQFDIDSVGVESDVADTEVIAAMCDSLGKLDVGRYNVRYSSRAILNLLLDFAAIPLERGPAVFRVLDKLEKIELPKVRLELMDGYVDSSGDRIKGVGLRQSQVDRIEAFLAVKSRSRGDVIAGLRSLFDHVHGANDEIDVLERISNHLDAMGYSDDRVTIDLSVARGLDYYTGTVFETALLDAPEFGSVFSGGRYDDLVLRFLGERLPAVGASLGVDRLLAAAAHLGKVRSRKATARVMVANIDYALTPDYLALTWELRRAGIPTELYLGPTLSIAKQLRYADQYGIPVVVLYGSLEKEQGTVTVKRMEVGRKASPHLAEREEWLAARHGQGNIPRGEVVAAVRRALIETERSA